MNEEIKDTGTGAVRATGGKGRMDLLPWIAIIRVSKHFEDALQKYPERDWEKGMPVHMCVDSAFRHLAKYTTGMCDEDHLAAAVTNLLMAMFMEERGPISALDLPWQKIAIPGTINRRASDFGEPDAEMARRLLVEHSTGGLTK